MDITLFLFVISIAISFYLTQSATNDSTEGRVNQTTYAKLFLAGFIFGFFVTFWLAPNNYYTKLKFGLLTGFFGGVVWIIRIPKGWESDRERL